MQCVASERKLKCYVTIETREEKRQNIKFRIFFRSRFWIQKKSSIVGVSFGVCSVVESLEIVSVYEFVKNTSRNHVIFRGKVCWLCIENQTNYRKCYEKLFFWTFSKNPLGIFFDLWHHPCTHPHQQLSLLGIMKAVFYDTTHSLRLLPRGFCLLSNKQNNTL